MKWLAILTLCTSCQLLEPSTTGGTRVDGSFEAGGVVVAPAETEPREATKADDVIDAVSTVGGTVTGNPVLWGLAGTLGHLLVGALRRKKEPAVG